MNGVDIDARAPDDSLFTADRQGEMQLALRYALGNAAQRAFSGVFEVLGRPVIEVDDPEAVAEWFGRALHDFICHEGAKGGRLNTAPDGQLYVAGADGGAVNAPPMETLQVFASIPSVLVTPTSVCHALQAVSEIVRIALATAISAAVEAACGGEVRLMFRDSDGPRFSGTTDPVTGVHAVGCELLLSVYVAADPSRSYFMGQRAGDKSPFKLRYAIPLPALAIGRDRLRWMDSRSPDAQRQLAIVGGAS